MQGHGGVAPLRIAAQKQPIPKGHSRRGAPGACRPQQVHRRRCLRPGVVIRMKPWRFAQAEKIGHDHGIAQGGEPNARHPLFQVADGTSLVAITVPCW
jgi:hypothetical protein